MEIPAIYCVFKGGEVRSAQVRIEGTALSFETEPQTVAFSAEGSEERMQVLVADVRGLGRRGLDDRLLKKMKFSGSDVWFLTFIRDIEDVFDSFMGNIVKLLIPYHTTRNDLVMKEAFEMSENCIPVLFVSKGMVMCRRGQTKDLRTAVEEMARIGFREVAVLDTDSMLTAYDWTSLNDRFPGLIPYIRKKDAMESAEFQNIIFDL
ncbi:MAG: hypothetical protein FWG60_01170 [Methanomassiliicoccaceae archaeon]|nr:hypothetical protein [Methanomassiliicoccaceae archaeon]